MPRHGSRRAMRTSAKLFGLITSLLLCAGAIGLDPTWKLFSNRSGWSINYPSNWTIASCKSCKDPTAPEVFVDFFPPKDRDSGWVMIEPLADKPSGMSADKWLAQLKQTANLNTQLGEQRITLHGLPALCVRYRNPQNNGGEETETVYVVSGSQSFAIEFSGKKPGFPLGSFRNYDIFLKMVQSFTVKP